MATTVINDMSIEPAAAPPTQAEAKAAEKGGEKPSSSIERELERVRRRNDERATRLWAY